MRIAFILLPLTLAASIEGTALGDSWKAGAAKVGPIDLEPFLDGTGLYLNLTKVIGTFMDELEQAFEKQIGEYTLFYLTYAHNATVQIEEAVSNANETTAADAFDPLIIEITDFVRKFIKDFQKPDNRETEGKHRKLASQKMDSSTSSQLIHSFNDFRYKAASIVKTDLAMLSSYIEEILFNGHEAVLQNMASIERRLETLISFPIPYVKEDLQNALTYWYKLQPHTSNTILMNFENSIMEAFAVEF